MNRADASNSNRNTPPSTQIGGGGVMTRVDHSIGLYENCTVIKEDYIAFSLPIRTLTPNQYEHWRKRAAREKDQRRAVMFAMIPLKEKYPKFFLTPGHFHLRFTRSAPKMMDAWDNLPFSFKKILDQACAEIVNDFVPGRADSYDCFSFEYAQVKTKGKDYSIRIEIFKSGSAAASPG